MYGNKREKTSLYICTLSLMGLSVQIGDPSFSDIFLCLFIFFTMARGIIATRILVIAYLIFAISMILPSMIGTYDAFPMFVRGYLLVVLACFATFSFRANSESLALVLRIWARFFVIISFMFLVAARFSQEIAYQVYQTAGRYRFQSAFDDPNVFAAALASALCVVFFYLILRAMNLTQEKWFVFVFDGLILTGGVALLWMAGSRAALLSFLVSVVFIMILMIWRFPRKSSLLILFFLCGGAVLGLAFVTSQSALSGDRFQMHSYDSYRFLAQIDGLRRGITAPLGHGVGSSVGALGDRWFAHSPHNGFIKVLYEQGYAGALTLLFFFALPFIPTVRRARFFESRELFLIQSLIVGLAVNGLFIDFNHWRHLFVILGLGVGLCLRLSSHSPRSPLQTHAPTISVRGTPKATISYNNFR
jgi:hypothetical protein